MKGTIWYSALFSLAAGHGILKTITVDGNLYEGYDAIFDIPWHQRRIEWMYSSNASAAGIGPVTDVTSPDITCRFTPLKAPALKAVARAGSDVEFKWTDYYNSHKGPVLTYMGRLPSPNAKPQDVSFFKIDEGAYYPETYSWGSDKLMKNNMTWKVTIPSDIKPGLYVMRHELIALHFGEKLNGAQFYVNCLNIEVTGKGTAEPEGVKFPGAYHAKDPGILDNIYYGVNRYIAPGPPLYQGRHDPPVGPQPVVRDTGIGSGPMWESYKRMKASAIAQFEAVVHRDDGENPGGGGCHWEPGQSEDSAHCDESNGGHESKATDTNGLGPPNGGMYALPGEFDKFGKPRTGNRLSGTTKTNGNTNANGASVGETQQPKKLQRRTELKDAAIGFF